MVPVIKNSPCNAGDIGSTPGLGGCCGATKPEIVKTLIKDGFTVSPETKYRFDISAYCFELYISWRK